jgi:hypothetical protein
LRLIGNLAFERMIELLRLALPFSVEMLMVELVGRLRAKPQNMRRRLARFQRRDRKELPLTDDWRENPPTAGVARRSTLPAFLSVGLPANFASHAPDMVLALNPEAEGDVTEEQWRKA